MKINANLNILSIIRYEQLTGKAFQEIDYQNENEIKDLLYATVVASNDEIVSRTDFDMLCENSSVFSEMVSKIKKHAEVVSVFSNLSTESGGNTESNQKSLYVTDVVSTLIMSGLDANFVYKMWICDLPQFIKAYESIERQKMEAQRLWTYYSILPHIDGKKIKTPADMYPFPWEIEDIEKKAKERQEKDEEVFYKFMNGEIKFN